MPIKGEDKSLVLSRRHPSISASRRIGWGNRYTKGATTVNSFVLELDTATQRKEAKPVDDAMLVAVARSGDSSAFVELSKRHSRRVLHRIYRMTKNWQDAEDVLQESMIRAFVHLHSFECRASFSTWLTSIAINSALMFLRKEKRILRSAIDSVHDDCAQTETWELRDHREDPEQHFARQQRAKMLRGAILRLRPELRRIIEIQQKHELSIKEMAQSLGISVSAAKSRLFRARIALREFVQDETQRCHTYSGSHSALRPK
jgi:RNA polymerase sigma factor (sigma-70 family)